MPYPSEWGEDTMGDYEWGRMAEVLDRPPERLLLSLPGVVEQIAAAIEDSDA